MFAHLTNLDLKKDFLSCSVCVCVLMCCHQFKHILLISFAILYNICTQTHRITVVFFLAFFFLFCRFIRFTLPKKNVKNSTTNGMPYCALPINWFELRFRITHTHTLSCGCYTLILPSTLPMFMSFHLKMLERMRALTCCSLTYKLTCIR